MKGWLSVPSKFLFRPGERFHFRLQWGFLSQHPTESSAASVTYFVFGAAILTDVRSRRLRIALSPAGVAHAAGTRNLTVTLIAPCTDTHSEWTRALSIAACAAFPGPYVLHSRIGAGASGEVWKASCNGTTAAVKVVHYTKGRGICTGARLRRIHAEVALQHKASRLSHTVPNVLGVLYDETHAYIAMDYADGGSLSTLLSQRNAPLRQEDARTIAKKLGKCILAIHQSGIVHRDIKADNVVLAMGRSECKVRLIDFGFATAWRQQPGTDITTFCRRFLGTEWYLAPEIVCGQAYGSPVDIYALGVLIHLCLLGTFPYKAANLRGTLALIKKGGLPTLGPQCSLSPSARSFCRALLNIDPKKRLSAAGLLQHKWIRGDSYPSRQAKTQTQGREQIKTVFRRLYWAALAYNALRGA